MYLVADFRPTQGEGDRGKIVTSAQFVHLSLVDFDGRITIGGSIDVCRVVKILYKKDLNGATTQGELVGVYIYTSQGRFSVYPGKHKPEAPIHEIVAFCANPQSQSLREAEE